MSVYYKLKMRVLDGHNVVGYMIESTDNLGDAFWAKDNVRDVADYGQIINVKNTINGLVGINGFEIKSLPSIQLKEAQRLQEIRDRNVINSNDLKKSTEKPVKKSKSRERFNVSKFVDSLIPS